MARLPKRTGGITAARWCERTTRVIDCALRVDREFDAAAELRHLTIREPTLAL